MIKKTIKQKIFDELDKTGYLTDSQVAKIYGAKEINFTTSENYKGMWRRFNADLNFFKGKKIIGVEKGHRIYLVKIDTGEFYKVGKDFYDEIQKTLA